MITRILFGVLVFLLLVGALYFSVRYTSGRHLSWHEDLRHLVRERPRGARIYVAENGQAVWLEVRSFQNDKLTVESGRQVPLNTTTAFVAAYESGEIIATSVPVPNNLPLRTYFARAVSEGIGHALSEADISGASTCVTISFDRLRDSGSRGQVYETRLTNHCPHPVRVTHFGAYIFHDGMWRLNTIVNGFFTAEQFREWYGTAEDGWLNPGVTAVDSENYGADALWVYFLESPDGKLDKAVGRAPL